MALQAGDRHDSARLVRITLRRRLHSAIVLIALLVALLVALPVQAAIDLQYFNAVSSSSAVLLEWATASEYNTAGFEILRKREGEPDSSFQRIGFYNAKGGPDQGAQYDTIVTNLQTGVAYCFRLREVTTEDEPGEVRDLCGYGIGVTPTYTPIATSTPDGTPTTSAVLFPTATVDPALGGQQPVPTIDPAFAGGVPTADPFAPVPTTDPFAPVPTWTPTVDPFAPVPTWTPTIDPFAPQSPLDTPTPDPFAPIPTWTPTIDPFAPIPTWTPTIDPFAAPVAAEQAIDPATGYMIDPATGLPIDPATGWPIDPATGFPFDPAFGVPSPVSQPDSPLQVPTATLDPAVAAGLAALDGVTPTPTALYIVVTAAPPPVNEGVAAVPSPWPTLAPTPAPALLGLLAPNAQNLTVLMLCFIFLSATTLGALGLMSVVLYLRARSQREDDRSRLRTKRYS